MKNFSFCVVFYLFLRNLDEYLEALYIYFGLIFLFAQNLGKFGQNEHQN